MESYRFGPYELRPDGSLMRGPRALDLPPKQRGLLEILVGARGRVVSKAELLDRLWPGEDVSEASLTTCVRGLRRALGDRGRRGGYLETVHGRGYRFHATQRSGGRVRVAVAPFACDGEARYFAEGLAGEIASGLDRWRDDGIDAIARDSAQRGWQRDRVAFAQRLDLQFLVVGRVHEAPDEVRIAIELCRAEDGGAVWSQEFAGPTRATGFLAAEIAESLAKRLLLDATGAGEVPAHPIAPLSADPRAYHAVLRGVFLNQYRDEAGLRRSIACFEQATQWDPRCAAAWSALGEAQLNLGWRGYVAPIEIAPLARRALARALAIDGGAGRAHAARAFLAALVDRDARTTEEALGLCAGAESGHDRSAFQCAFAQLALQRPERALAIVDSGLVVDPLSPNLSIARATTLWFAGRWDDALAQVRVLTEMEPEFPAGHALRADVAASLDSPREALRHAERADALGRGDQMTRSACAWAFGRSGRGDAGLAILQGFERRAAHRYVAPTFMAVGYAGLGDHESALRWLERAESARCMWLALAPLDPRLAVLREEPRAALLLARTALAAAPGASARA